MTAKYTCMTCRYRERNPNDDDWCHILEDWLSGLEFDIFEKVGCASHSEFNKPKKPHDIEEFYKEEKIPKYKDAIFEETEDGGAIIGYLTESPSGYARSNVAKLTKDQYIDYKKNEINYGD